MGPTLTPLLSFILSFIRGFQDWPRKKKASKKKKMKKEGEKLMKKFKGAVTHFKKRHLKNKFCECISEYLCVFCGSVNAVVRTCKTAAH